MLLAYIMTDTIMVSITIVQIINIITRITTAAQLSYNGEDGRNDKSFA